MTFRAGAKAGFSDPVFLSGREIAHRTKVTPGITALSAPRDRIDGLVCDIDVGYRYPRAVEGPKGWAVRPLII